MLHPSPLHFSFFSFFFTDPATTEIYTLSLHDALPISEWFEFASRIKKAFPEFEMREIADDDPIFHTVYDITDRYRSEEHTSELQSRRDLVCRLLLEKKKKKKKKKDKKINMHN